MRHDIRQGILQKEASVVAAVTTRGVNEYPVIMFLALLQMPDRIALHNSQFIDAQNFGVVSQCLHALGLKFVGGNMITAQGYGHGIDAESGSHVEHTPIMAYEKRMEKGDILVCRLFGRLCRAETESGIMQEPRQLTGCFAAHLYLHTGIVHAERHRFAVISKPQRIHVGMLVILYKFKIFFHKSGFHH